MQQMASTLVAAIAVICNVIFTIILIALVTRLINPSTTLLVDMIAVEAGMVCAILALDNETT